MATTWRGARPFSVALGFVIVLGAACQPVPRQGSVDVVGHSITQQAFDADGDGVSAPGAGAPLDLQLHVYMGWTVPDVQEWVDAEADLGRPATLVVDLGVNDATPHWGGDGWTDADVANFSTLLHTPHADTCVVLVLPAVTSSAPAGLAPHVADARAAIAALAAERPRTVLLDFASFMAAHPEHIDDDGVHLLTPSTTTLEDLQLAAQGLMPPTEPAAAEAMQAFYWSGIARCDALREAATG